MKKSSTKSGTTGYRKSYATGGQSSSPWLSMAQQIPGILDSIISLADNNSNAQTTQPILNSSTMHSMVSPYSQFAFGGEDGLDEDQLAQLQQMADDNGMTIEELIQELSQQQDQSSDDQSTYGDDSSDDSSNDDQQSNPEFAMGGNWIKGAVNPKHKGYCTPMTKSTCTPKRKAFAMTMKKHHGFHKKAMGGLSNDNINVEGNEVLESPSGRIAKVKGPKHEQGGVDVNVPSGTKIFSDRLKIGNKSMQERKLGRARAMNRLQKLTDKNPTDQLLKNTLKRTTLNHDIEEDKDMTLQKAANAIYQSPKFSTGMGMGGKVKEKKYAFGSDGTDTGSPYFDKFGQHYVLPPSMSSFSSDDLMPTDDPLAANNNPSNFGNLDKPAIGSRTTSNDSLTYSAANAGRMTAGDYVGLAGNAFNAIAPIINTGRAARATKPNINRFRGFGRKALEDNNSAENYVAGLRSDELTDIDTSANSSYARNRNSATSVNTVRALDEATDIGKSKARSSANNSFAKEMIGILGQRSELDNQKDQAEMAGATSRDLEDKGDIDSFYSNMANNLVNFGTNVQGIGKNLNVSKSNRVNANLISKLSKYGLAFDDDGNLVSTGR